MLMIINEKPNVIPKHPMANILVIWPIEYLMNSSNMESHLGIRMIGYSFLKTTSTRKKLNIPLPNPTSIQSINPASLEVNATPMAVATAIKIYMNHFRLSFIIQVWINGYLISYANKRPNKATRTAYS